VRLVIRRALEKRFGESYPGQRGTETGVAVEYLQHWEATLDGLRTAFRTVWKTKNGLKKGRRGFNGCENS
jgi:hypothetical protein